MASSTTESSNAGELKSTDRPDIAAIYVDSHFELPKPHRPHPIQRNLDNITQQFPTVITLTSASELARVLTRMEQPGCRCALAIFFSTGPNTSDSYNVSRQTQAASDEPPLLLKFLMDFIGPLVILPIAILSKDPGLLTNNEDEEDPGLIWVRRGAVCAIGPEISLETARNMYYITYSRHQRFIFPNAPESFSPAKKLKSLKEEIILEPERKSFMDWIDDRRINTTADKVLNSVIIDYCSIPQYKYDYTAPLSDSIISLDISTRRQQQLKKMINSREFRIWEISSDEQVWCVYDILSTVLQLPQMAPFRLSPGKLYRLLLLIRSSYRPYNFYHNFRHAVDVLQTMYIFLKQSGLLSPSVGDGDSFPQDSCLRFLHPADPLALLLSALGHDTGHPGVTNLYLQTKRSPIAQLYNDRSILESFHSAVFNRLLSIHWPATQDNHIREMIIDCILATDMAKHFDYVKELSQLKILLKDKNSKAYTNQQEGSKIRKLVGALLMKSADISNVTRPREISQFWGEALLKETEQMEAIDKTFANGPEQSGLDNEPFLQVTLASAHRDSRMRELSTIEEKSKLAECQISFINMFADGLFEFLSELIPDLDFTIKQVRENKADWIAFQKEISNSSSAN